MKKALVVVLALVMTLSVVGLVSCAGKTYEGEYKYENPYAKGNYYGAKVKVTIQGNVITNVELLSDSETGWTNLSPNWTSNGYAGGAAAEAAPDSQGKTNWRKYGKAMVESFTGLTTEEVLGIKVFINKNGEPYTTNDYSIETIKYVPDQLAVVMNGHGEFGKGTGATQSSARVILAVQNAILKSQGKTENANCVLLDLGTTATSYGLVHGKGYVGQATVTVKYGKITDAKLDETCLPTYVNPTGEANEYIVSGKVISHNNPTTKLFYKTVKFADVTMEYNTDEIDATYTQNDEEKTTKISKGYMVGNKTMLEFFADEANCKKYAEAVANGEVAVVMADGDKKDVMTAAALVKSQNGYWGTPATNALGWKANVEATCKYVKENGFDGVTKKEDLTNKDNSATNPKLDNELVDKNGVATGATWTDMWDYVNLLHNAFNQASK